MADEIGVTFSIANIPEWKTLLDQIDSAMRGEAIVIALLSGAEIIRNDWASNAPYKTGHYRRSVHVARGDVTAKSVEVLVGTDVEYGPRLEYGFCGVDSLGRKYHQAARPHARPAFENNRDKVEKEIGGALNDILKAFTK
jgi:hypothetical protein